MGNSCLFNKKATLKVVQNSALSYPKYSDDNINSLTEKPVCSVNVNTSEVSEFPSGTACDGTKGQTVSQTVPNAEEIAIVALTERLLKENDARRANEGGASPEESPELLHLDCLHNGFLEKLLLRIGTLQGEKPRDSPQTEKARTEAEKKNTAKNVTPGSAAARSPVALWTPGYGCGASPGTRMSVDEIARKNKERSESTIKAFNCFAAFLELPNEQASKNFQEEDWKLLEKTIDSSPVLKVFMAYFLGASSDFVLSQSELYTAMLRCVIGLASHPELASLLGPLPGMYTSVEQLMNTNVEIIEDLDELLVCEGTEDNKWVRALLVDAIAAVNANRRAFKAEPETDDTEGGGESKEGSEDENCEGDDEESIESLYEATLKPLLFKAIDMDVTRHHYKEAIKKVRAAKKKRQMRLKKELKRLKRDMPLHFGSSCFLRVDKTRLHVMQVLMTGPSNTPYDSGCFQFDLYCNSDYPTVAPKLNLETTGGGTVRFNPNLYKCGKVCLSLLGTWAGGASGTENWTKQSSIWQVLVSIQSAILGSQYPYFNEPGVERQWGTSSGKRQCRTAQNGGYERLRVASIQHAMVGQLRNPSKGFESVVREHFRLKGPYIISQIEGWIEEAKASPTPDHKKALEKQLKEFKAELAKLEYHPKAATKAKYTYTKYEF